MSGAKLRVLLVYTGMIPSVEISALRPLQYLQRCGRIQLKHTTVFEADDERHLCWCDVAVCCRCCMVNELSFLSKLIALGIPYVYDLDDNFIRLAESDLPDVEYLRWEGSRQTVRAFARNAFRVKVGSQQLREDLAPYTDRCVIHPYAFDFPLLSPVREHAPKDGAVHIVYAGSLTHTVDLAAIRGALLRVLDRYPGKVRLSFYGAPVGGFEAYGNAVDFIPYQYDYASFMRDFSSRWFDIALAPLQDNLSNRSKTNNKYREYAACRVAGIYSDMPVYADCVRPEVNGMLAGYSEEAWFEAIVRLGEDPALRARIVEKAWRDVHENNTLEAAGERWYHELLSPMRAQAKAVARRDRRNMLRTNRRAIRQWVYRRVSEDADSAARRFTLLYQYRVRLAYIDAKEGLKYCLKRLGIFEPLKRLKDGLTLRKKGESA